MNEQLLHNHHFRGATCIQCCKSKKGSNHLLRGNLYTTHYSIGFIKLFIFYSFVVSVTGSRSCVFLLPVLIAALAATDPRMWSRAGYTVVLPGGVEQQKQSQQETDLITARNATAATGISFIIDLTLCFM